MHAKFHSHMPIASKNVFTRLDIKYLKSKDTDITINSKIRLKIYETYTSYSKKKSMLKQIIDIHIHFIFLSFRYSQHSE